MGYKTEKVDSGAGRPKRSIKDQGVWVSTWGILVEGDCSGESNSFWSWTVAVLVGTVLYWLDGLAPGGWARDLDDHHCVLMSEVGRRAFHLVSLPVLVLRMVCSVHWRVGLVTLVVWSIEVGARRRR